VFSTTSETRLKLILSLLRMPISPLRRRRKQTTQTYHFDRARKQRKTLGRPKRIFDKEMAVALQAEGKSLCEIATILAVNKDTVRAALMTVNTSAAVTTARCV
jgi:hypothetical protein